MLRIVRCPDPLMWYAGLVGELVPWVGQWPEGYKSLEPEGYLNVVRFEDAEIVDLLETTTTHDDAVDSAWAPTKPS